MKDLREWFWGNTGYRFVVLFDSDEGLLVRTKELGKDKKRTLCRSKPMEEAIIEIVETGLNSEKWQGLLYIMGFGEVSSFTPLYVGKAERRGVKHEVSGNLVNIRHNYGKFARWGDGLDFHIGDLSQTLFRFQGYRGPRKKYQRWADRLFLQMDPPRLKETVYLYLAPWFEGSVGPSGLSVSLPAVEKEVIALASIAFPETLMNVDGV